MTLIVGAAGAAGITRRRVRVSSLARVFGSLYGVSDVTSIVLKNGGGATVATASRDSDGAVLGKLAIPATPGTYTLHTGAVSLGNVTVEAALGGGGSATLTPGTNTLAAAVNALNDGDTLYLQPGIYRITGTSTQILSKAVTIFATGNVYIELNSTSTAIDIRADVEFRGIVFTSNGAGPPFYISNNQTCQPLFRLCEFYAFHVIGGNDALRKCSFDRCRWTYGASMMAYNCWFYGCDFFGGPPTSDYALQLNGDENLVEHTRFHYTARLINLRECFSSAIVKVIGTSNAYNNNNEKLIAEDWEVKNLLIDSCDIEGAGPFLQLWNNPAVPKVMTFRDILVSRTKIGDSSEVLMVSLPTSGSVCANIRFDQCIARFCKTVASIDVADDADTGIVFSNFLVESQSPARDNGLQIKAPNTNGTDYALTDLTWNPSGHRLTSAAATFHPGLVGCYVTITGGAGWPTGDKMVYAYIDEHTLQLQNNINPGGTLSAGTGTIAGVRLLSCGGAANTFHGWILNPITVDATNGHGFTFSGAVAQQGGGIVVPPNPGEPEPLPAPSGFTNGQFYTVDPSGTPVPGTPVEIRMRYAPTGKGYLYDPAPITLTSDGEGKVIHTLAKGATYYIGGRSVRVPTGAGSSFIVKNLVRTA
jgi:hypothetical protein